MSVILNYVNAYEISVFLALMVASFKRIGFLVLTRTPVNILLFEGRELSQKSSIVVSDRRAEHLLRVLNVQPGSSVKVGMLGGAKGKGIVSDISDGKVSLDVELGMGQGEQPWFDLYLALPRPRMLTRVLSTLASLGARKIALFSSQRVEKSYFSSSVLAQEHIQQQLRLGLEQSGGTIAPTVDVVTSWREFKQRYLSCANDDRKFIFEARAEKDLAEIDVPVVREDYLKIALGPEGGFVDGELEEFQNNGFELMRIGRRVLRVEVAVTAIVSQLDLLRRIAP